MNSKWESVLGFSDFLHSVNFNTYMTDDYWKGWFLSGLKVFYQTPRIFQYLKENSGF